MFLHWDEEVRNYEQMKVGGELLNFSQRKLLLLDQVDINLTKMFCDVTFVRTSGKQPPEWMKTVDDKNKKYFNLPIVWQHKLQLLSQTIVILFTKVPNLQCQHVQEILPEYRWHLVQICLILNTLLPFMLTNISLKHLSWWINDNFPMSGGCLQEFMYQ